MSHGNKLRFLAMDRRPTAAEVRSGLWAFSKGVRGQPCNIGA